VSTWANVNQEFGLRLLPGAAAKSVRFLAETIRNLLLIKQIKTIEKFWFPPKLAPSRFGM
jgi:hypothetical protein